MNERQHFLLAPGTLLLTGTAAVMLVVFACGDTHSPLEADNTFAPESQSPSESDGDDPPEYSGDDEHVLEAVERFRTGNDLHKKAIVRTCGPDNGVCHNQAEYPNLSTTASFLDTIEAPCNIAPGDYGSVDDRCEQPGDRFRLAEVSGGEIEIGYVHHVQGESRDWADEEELPGEDATGLHVHLRHSVDTDRDEVWSNAQFIRAFVNEEGIVEDIPYANLTTRWWVLGEGDHIFGEVRAHQVDEVNELMSVGIVQGDLNRNGVFGASESEPYSLIEPGDPESSYLIGRMRGIMNDEEVPGSRMPLANQPWTISEMLALFCFVEGLPGDGSWPDMTQPIDYENCSFAEDPEELNLLGEGVTWASRVSQIFDASCAGCHGGDNPDEDLNLHSQYEDAYDNLFEPSTQNPDMQLIEPGEPENSYIWLKLTGHDDIEGDQMPIDGGTGEPIPLGDAELGDIETWITNDAVRDE